MRSRTATRRPDPRGVLRPGSWTDQSGWVWTDASTATQRGHAIRSDETFPARSPPPEGGPVTASHAGRRSTARSPRTADRRLASVPWRQAGRKRCCARGSAARMPGRRGLGADGCRMADRASRAPASGGLLPEGNIAPGQHEAGPDRVSGMGVAFPGATSPGCPAGVAHRLVEHAATLPGRGGEGHGGQRRDRVRRDVQASAGRMMPAPNRGFDRPDLWW